MKITAISIFLLGVLALILRGPSPGPRRPSFDDYLERRADRLPASRTLRPVTVPTPAPTPTPPKGPPPPWVEKLSAQLKRFQDDDAEIQIKREGTVVGREAIYRKVVISYKKGQQKSSFRALIDPKDGRIVRTWDRTISEKRPSFSLDTTF